MGAIADAMVKYAQPLIDATDGSMEQVERALLISQACWNLALVPEDERNESLAELRPALGMDDDEFEAFRQNFLGPMIQRHKEMFPRMHQRSSLQAPGSWEVPSSPPVEPSRGGKYAGTDRYAPCPCGSGEKYKFCCGRK